MGRSRMFDDQAPENAVNPSPRTTIVGGRPPEGATPTLPVPTGLQKLLRLASVDPGFAKELIEKRDATADAANVDLNDRERAMLKAVPGEQLAEMIMNLPPPPEGRRDFLRQTAATAVVLLGGAVLSGCEKEAGKAAQPPAPPPEEQIPRPQNLHGTRGIQPFPGTEPAPTAGIRPDPPPTGGQYSQPPPGWDGGEPPPPRPDETPRPTGIRPDVPPPPPPRPDGGTPPDEEPEPPRPDQPNSTRGIRPGLKSFGHDTDTE
jgi:hypothetical protein